MCKKWLIHSQKNRRLYKKSLAVNAVNVLLLQMHLFYFGGINVIWQVTLNILKQVCMVWKGVSDIRHPVLVFLTSPLDWLILQTGSKLPSALPTFLGSIQGEDLGVDEEEQLGSDEQGRSSEELATCSSQDQAMMQDCYSKIVEKLSLANPSMVLQVEGWPRLHVLYGGGAILFLLESTTAKVQLKEMWFSQMIDLCVPTRSSSWWVSCAESRCCGMNCG